jgi:hypothetical protein
MQQKDLITFIQGLGENAKKVTVALPDGYRETNFFSSGERVYTNGTSFITPDKTGHKGGVFKKASSVENLGSVDTRDGTYDENLNRIAD